LAWIYTYRAALWRRERLRVSKSSQRDLVRAFLLRHNLRNKRPVPLAVAPRRGSGTVVRHSHCTLLRHIKTAQQRVDLPHRAATTKASMYSRACGNYAESAIASSGQLGELLGAFGNTL